MKILKKSIYGLLFKDDYKIYDKRIKESEPSLLSFSWTKPNCPTYGRRTLLIKLYEWCKK